MKKIESNISLKSVSKDDFKFLFELLKERDPKANISHKKMPSYATHVKFIKSKPYTKWYVILNFKQKVGSIYLSKNNEIGIFLLKTSHRQNFGKIALEMLMKKNPRKRFLANVSPENKISMDFFKKNGFNLIQYTFEK